MIENELTPGAQDALGRLKSQRGACPSAETLVAYEALSPGDRERRPEHAHISICSRCQLVLLHAAPHEGAPYGTQSRAPLLGAPVGKWLLPLAAVVALAVGASLVNWRAPAGLTSDTIRGLELQTIAPAGSVGNVITFRWLSPIQSPSYRVTVRRGPEIVWVANSETTERAVPSATLFERGVEYTWQVEAIDREGEARMASPPQSFVLAR